jgi:hypothetical protein
MRWHDRLLRCRDGGGSGIRRRDLRRRSSGRFWSRGRLDRNRRRRGGRGRPGRLLLGGLLDDRGAGRGGRRPRRQEEQRVEVAVLLGRQPDAEMDVRHGRLRIPGRADRADPLAFLDSGVPLHPSRAEMDERDGVAVVGLNGHGQAARRDRAHEGNRACSGRQDCLAAVAADVDAAVLSGCIGVGTEAEWGQQRAGRGPRPRPGRRCKHQHQEPDRSECSQKRQQVIHPRESLPPLSNVVTVSSQRLPVEGIPGCAREPRDEIGCLTPRHPGRDQLGDGLHRSSALIRPGWLGRTDDERDLAARRLREALCKLDCGSSHGFLELLGELTTHGNRAQRDRLRQGS